MAAFPVIEDDRVRVVIVAVMTVQLLLGRAAAQVFNGRIDEPDADVIPRARPSIGRCLVLHARVTVFVLDGIFVGALAHDALLLRMNHHAAAPVGWRAF